MWTWGRGVQGEAGSGKHGVRADKDAGAAGRLRALPGWEPAAGRARRAGQSAAQMPGSGYSDLPSKFPIAENDPLLLPKYLSVILDTEIPPLFLVPLSYIQLVTSK